jgi:Na+/proline symporter
MVIAALPALAIPFIFPTMTNGDQFTPAFVAAYFPPVIKGVLIASLLGLLLTTGDTFLLLLSSTVTNDIIPLFRKDIDDKKMLNINRIIVVVSAAVIVLMGMYWKSIFALFRLGGSAYGAGVFFPVLLGCFWKKAKTLPINIGMFTGCLVSFSWDFLLQNSTGINGVIPGAALCLLICLVGSLVYKESSNGKLSENNA